MSGAKQWEIAPGGRANGGALVIRDADDRPVATMWLREDAYQLACVVAAAPALIEALEATMRRLESAQWQGYVTEGGERACPCCEAWCYQGDGVEPRHAYACGLAADIEAARAAIAAARGGK